MSRRRNDDLQRDYRKDIPEFAILKKWGICFDATTDHKPGVVFSGSSEQATIFCWPKNEPEPPDFLFHAYLHIALRALQRMRSGKRKKAEERLICDICKHFRLHAAGFKCQ